METIDRKEYIKEYHDMAGKLIFNEKLPLINDILDFATKGKTNDRLQHVFGFFGDEDEQGCSEEDIYKAFEQRRLDLRS